MSNYIQNRHEHHRKIIEAFDLPHFCAAPWNSLHEGPQGLVSTCCKTREPIGFSTEKTFGEMYNSDHAKSVRADFLAGKKPAQCKACWEQETDNKPSLNRLHSNAMSDFDNLKELVENTDADGYMHVQKPEWLDLLWTSKCNFACLGCSPELSSTINNKYKREFAVLNGNNPDTYHSNMTNWDNGAQHKLDYVLEHADTIHTIHLNGGEPWMQEETYMLLDELLKRGLHKKILIWTHTNGSITKSYKGVDIIEDYLVHWGENCKVTMSNDGFGSVGEYTRYGYRDTKWLETYRRVREAGVRLGIQACINVFNSTNIHELGEWLCDNCLPAKSSAFDVPDGSLTLWTNPTTTPTLLAHVPELQQKAIDSFTQMMETGRHPYSWRENIHRWIKLLERATPGENKNLLSWKRGLDLLDAKRGTNLREAVPNLIPLYERAIEIEHQMDQTHSHTS